MPAVGRRALAVAALAVVLSGCGGPPDTSSSASSAPSAAPTTVPPPSGVGCVGAGDLGELSELPLVDALKSLPVTTAFAGYAAADPERAKKLNALSGVSAFVPVDAAWQTLDEATTQALADPAIQQSVVEYALVAQAVLPQDITDGDAKALATFRGPDVMMSVVQAGDETRINSAASVVCSAIPFDGGYLYLTDRLLLPPS